MDLSGVLQDTRHAVRGLGRTPGFTLVALATLGLGIGANTAVFSVVDRVLLRPLPYRNPERLEVIGGDQSRLGNPDLLVASAEYRDIAERVKSVEDVAAGWSINANLTGGAEPRRVRAALVSWNLFSVLGVSPALGRTFASDDAAGDIGFVAVLSYEAWQQLFGGRRDVVGTTIHIDDDPMTVVGVMPRGFRQPADSRTDPVVVWLPIDFTPGNRWDSRSYRQLTLVARLAPGVSAAALQTELDATSRAIAAEHPAAYPSEAGWSLRAEPLRERMVGDLRATLLIVMGAVAFVLLIACTNLASLLLARGQARARELAVRSALGGGRGRLVRKLLIESLVLGVAGGTVGVGVAVAALALLRQAAAPMLPALGDIRVDGGMLIVTGATTVLATLLFGLLPALRNSRVEPQELLGTRTGAGAPGSRIRAALTTAQVAISLVLLVGTGLLVRTFSHLSSLDPGFDPERVLALESWLPIPNDPPTGPYFNLPQRTTFADQALRRLEAEPSIAEGAVVSLLPFRERANATAPVEVVGRPPPPDAARPLAQFRVVSAKYFDVMGIPLLHGRVLNAHDDSTAPLAVVVDARAAELWLGEDPVGKHLHLGGGQATFDVVGEVGNVRDEALDVAPRPHVYLSYKQALGYDLTFVVKTRGAPRESEAVARRDIRAVDPDQPVFAVASMDEVMAETTARERLVLELLSVFAALALSLTALGVYGVVSYSVRQRTPEIGIRMALGAGRPQIVGLALAEVAQMGSVGVLVGLVVAALLSRLMGSLLHGVPALDLPAFAAAAGVTLLVGLLAGALPAGRAARLDPVESLRAE